MTDYTNARFYAISNAGYGKGHTAVEAAVNYIESVTRDIKIKQTVFKDRTEMVEYFTNGPGAAIVWEAPEGTVGFVLGSVPGHGIVPQWEGKDGKYTVSSESQVIHNPHVEAKR